MLLVEMQNGAAALENSMESPQKIKTGATTQFSNLTSEYLPKRIEGRISN